MGIVAGRGIEERTTARRMFSRGWFARFLAAAALTKGQLPETPGEQGKAFDWRSGLPYAGILALVCFFCICYLRHPTVPGGDTRFPLGWYGWSDQAQYLKSLKAIVSWEFGYQSHWYPIGYSLLAVPFYLVLPKHPFFIPNLLMFVGCCCLLYSIYRRLLPPGDSVVLLAGFLIVTPRFIQDMVVPWNTIPLAFILYALIGLTLPPLKQRSYIVACFLAGLLPYFKPSEIVVAVPLLLLAPLGDPTTPYVWYMKRFGTIVGSMGAACLMWNRLVFGSAIPGYYVNESNIGFDFRSIGFKLYSVVLDGHPLYGQTDTLVKLCPWILISVPGIVYTVRKFGPAGWGTVLAGTATVAIYFGYNNFNSYNAFQYLLLHYIDWLLPLLAFAAYLTVRLAWRQLPPILFAVCLAVPLAIGGVLRVQFDPVKPGMTAVSLVDDQPAQMVVDGDLTRNWQASIPGTGGRMLLRITAASPATFDAICFWNWPQGPVYPDIEIDGKMLRRYKDYGLNRQPGVLCTAFHVPMKASTIGVGVGNPSSPGTFTVSEVGLFRKHWFLLKP